MNFTIPKIKKSFKLGFGLAIASVLLLMSSCSLISYNKLSKEEKVVKKWDGKVKRYFYDEDSFEVYGSFFKIRKSYITARHVITEAFYTYPDFAKEDMLWENGLNGLDISIYRKGSIGKYKFQEVSRGCKTIAIGYPAGSKEIEYRYGSVLTQRNNQQWISTISKPKEPVTNGMSGGLVLASCNEGKYLPAGVIVTRNWKADVNNTNVKQHSYDFVSITDALDI